MSKSKKAEKPSSSYKIGDRTVAQSYWNGNDYVTQYNPTDSESQSMNNLQNASAQAYADATNNANREAYRTNWINNQTKTLNELANQNLTTLKDQLITGGKVNSSTGWNQIGKFSDSYTDALSDIAANADNNALLYQNNLLNYANSLQGAMDNFYNQALGTTQSTANNQQNAAQQNLQYQAFNNQIGNSGLSNLYGGVQAGSGLASALLGTDGIASLASMAAGGV